MNEEKIVILLSLPNRVLLPNVMVGSIRGRMMKASSSKKYRKSTCEQIQNEQLESLPWKQISVSPVFYFKDHRRRDEDNYLASLKSVYDGIVDSGVIPDDTREYMIRTMPKFEIDKENPRVELIITREQ